MSICNFTTTPTTAGTFQQHCPDCEYATITRQPKLYRQCPRATPDVTLAGMGVGVTIAFAKWASAGFPVRTTEQRAELFAICQGCKSFRPGAVAGTGSCGKCGCRVKAKSTLANKAAWATEQCPLGLWPTFNAEVVLSAGGGSAVVGIPETVSIPDHSASASGQ